MPIASFRCTSALSGLLMLAACQPQVETLERTVKPPGKVTLGVIRQGAQASEEGVLAFTHQGYTLELSAFYMVVADMELHACARDEPERAALDWLIPRAHAHVPDSATRLGTPTLIDLLGPTGRARILGELAPPLGAYCAVRVVLAPADEDVVNLTTLGPDEVTGHSAIIEGRWRPATHVEGQPASWHQVSTRLDMTRTWTITLPEPIMLTGKTPSAFVLIESTLDKALLEVVSKEFESSEPRTQEKLATTLLELVAATQQRYTAPRAK